MEGRTILSRMYLSRFLGEKIDREFRKGNLHGTTHLSIGQEASHTGLSMALREGDWLVPTHRCHGFNVATGSSLFSIFSEMLGSKYGLCKGIGGSMHMTDISRGNLGSSAVVGSGVSLAGGCAFALRRQGRQNIAVAVFGDGASSRGSVHEMMNLASVWRLPLLFYMENNHYGMSAPSSLMVSTPLVAKRAEGYGMEWKAVDGNDVEAVFAAAKDAREYILREGRPFFLEVDTYRQCGHSKSDRLVYRTRQEEEEWREKDPIERYERTLLERGTLSPSDISSIRDEAFSSVEKAWDEAWEKRDEILSREELGSLVFPPPEKIEGDCFRTSHRASYREAINEALATLMEKDGRVTMMGEDIGRYGGCFGVSRGLQERFPSRILETPVSEEAFTGLAAGAAMLGERPVVEIMYADFMTLASDALVNHGAKAYFMSGGQLMCPMVVRTAMGGGTGHGAQHTQCPESAFLGIPALRVVAPSTPSSAKALLLGAARENTPVLFLEHKALYGEEGDVYDDSFVLPLGRAIVEEEGDSLLVIGYSRAFTVARKALGGRGCTFLDIASLSPLPEDDILNYASKIRDVLIVQDSTLIGSVGEHVAFLIYSAGCGNRIRILGAGDMPLPFSPSLERSCLLQEDTILAAAKELSGGRI